jgi:sphingolipid delta-4 desaturase
MRMNDLSTSTHPKNSQLSRFQKSSVSFTVADTPQPHFVRRQKLLAAHPELSQLFGNTPISALHILGLVSAQMAICFFLRNQSMWAILFVSWFVGAFLDHNMWIMIHESTHNLVLKSNFGNRCTAMFSNLPLIFPASMGFRTYHLLHHRHQGEFDHDADLPGPTEARLVGNSSLRKFLWLLNFWIIEGVVRPARLGEIKLWDRWVIINLVAQVAFSAGVTFFFGWHAIAYLFLSLLFSVGLHPVGARWIQEHYVVNPGQETYSYYGPLNWVCYHIGYHNEHHDLTMVPWTKIKKVKQIAPEFYDSLYSHQSWSKLLVRFIFDSKLGLYSRIVRPGNG